MEIFRLVFSLSAEHRWEIGEMYIAAVYLQAKGFDRDVFVKPPKEDNSANMLWSLPDSAYVLTNSRLLWYLTSNHSLTETFGLSRSMFEPTLCYRNDGKGKPEFVLVTQVDTYIYTGISEMQERRIRYKRTQAQNF